MSEIWYENYGQGHLRLKFFKGGQTSVKVKNLWYHVKGLVTKNAHMKFLSLLVYDSYDQARLAFTFGFDYFLISDFISLWCKSFELVLRCF